MPYFAEGTLKVLKRKNIIPESAPEWLNVEYVAKLLDDYWKRGEENNNWTPEVNDWFYCQEFDKVLKIESLNRYYSESASQKGQSDSCDIHIPESKLKRGN